MKINHYTVLAIVSILLTIAGLSWLSYTIKKTDNIGFKLLLVLLVFPDQLQLILVSL